MAIQLQPIAIITGATKYDLPSGKTEKPHSGLFHFNGAIMPTYMFRNKETGEEFEEFMSISAKEKYLAENEQFEQIHGSVGIISGYGDVDGRTDSTWKDVLSNIADKHPNSALAERYGRKTIKEIKTNQILDKHIRKQQKER
jgi:hypothetical protein